MKPLCFDSEAQYNDWIECCRLTEVSRDNYCHDCTPEYKKKMINCGRCTHPETFFYMRNLSKEAEKEMIGYSFVSIMKLRSVTNQGQAERAHFKKMVRMGVTGALVE